MTISDDSKTDADQAKPDAPQPKQTASLSFVDMAQVGTFMLLFLAALKYASIILIPLTLAILLSLLLAPAVNALESLHIPKRLGSAFVVAAIVTIIVTAISVLSTPTQEWIEKSPDVLQRIEEKLQIIKEPIQKVKEAADEVEGLAEVEENTTNLEVEPDTKKLFTMIFSATPDLLTFLVLSIVLLYFLLFSGENIAKYIIAAIYWIAGQKATVDMGHSIQQQISGYLLTITIINGCLGTLVCIALAIIGIPNPVLWGVMAALLNYAPYLGALTSALIIAIVSLVTFETLPQILLAPSVFLILTTLEGQFITPQILGNRFAMNPLIVFLSIIVWGWLWGYVGALLAFPILVIIKIMAQSVDVLHPMVGLLEDGSSFNGRSDEK